MWQWTAIDNIVDGNLQRQGRQESDHAAQQAQEQHPSQAHPVRSNLADEPAVEGKVAVPSTARLVMTIGTAHSSHASAARSHSANLGSYQRISSTYHSTPPRAKPEFSQARALINRNIRPTWTHWRTSARATCGQNDCTTNQ